MWSKSCIHLLVGHLTIKYNITFISILHPFPGDIYGIIAALCQVEVIIVAIVTGLVVHFVTKVSIKRNLPLSLDRKGISAELGPARADNSRDVYEPVGPGGSTGGEFVEVQPSPAYQAVTEPDYL